MNLGKMIGTGNTANVFEWEEGKVLKLFHKGYPVEAVQREFNNAMAIKDMNFPKPNVYEIIQYEDQLGIIYEKVEGESLLDWVMKTGDVEKCASHMATLHKEILSYRTTDVPNYKDFLSYHIKNAKSIDQVQKEEVIDLLNNLKDSDTLCHGDLHPGNIFLSDDHIMAIDFMNICHGDYLYDVARTVYLVEYTPVPENTENKEIIIQFKKALADLYLMQMNVTRDQIQDYLTLITVARSSEG